MATQSYGDPQFHGLDCFHDPKDCASGFSARLDNLDVLGGRLIVRPGKVGVLSAALASALYCPKAIIQTADGSSNIWFAQGTGLRKYVPGATSTTAIALPGGVTLIAANVRIHQAGGFVYVCDGSTYGGTTGLLRFLPDGSGGEVVAGLTKPTAPSSVVVSHLSFAGLNAPGALTWVSTGLSSLLNIISGTNNLPTSSNTGASGSGKYWIESSSGTFTFQAMPSNAAINGLRLSGTGTGYIEMLAPVATTSGIDPDVFQVVVSAECAANSGNNPGRMFFTLTAYDSGPAIIGTQTFDIGPIIVGKIQDYSATFDFRGLGVKYVSLRLGDDNTGNGYSGADPVFRDIRVYSADSTLYIPVVTGNLLVNSGSLYASPAGNVVTSDGIRTMSPLPQPTAFYTRNKRFYTAITLPAPGLSAAQRISMGVTLNYPATDFVPVRLFIENAGGSRAYGPLTALTPQNATVVEMDLTTVAAAITSAPTKVGVEFGDDIPTSGYAGNYRNTAATSPLLLTITDISKPGNLTPNTSLTYRVVEWNASNDATYLRNVILSDGSNSSVAIIPTVTDAVATVTLAARVNATSTHFALYRFGDFDDGFGRLVCVEPWALTASNFVAPNDANKGALPFYAAPANPFVDVTFTASAGIAGVIIADNTPSSWLLTAQNYIGGRETPPLKVREIIDFQGRLWLLAGYDATASPPVRRSELYGSWLLSNDSNAGIYFSRSVDPSDPDAPIKGMYTHIGTQDNDIALRMIALEDRLVFLFERKAPYLMTGSDPSNYSIRPFTAQSSALGLAARDAAMLYGGAIVYLTPNGLIRWDTENTPQPFSLPVQSLLNPAVSYLQAAPLNAAAYALCSLWQHGGRLYLAAPGLSTDTANTVIYRFDPKEGAPAGAIMGDYSGGAWTRWNQGAVTGGVALVGASDSNGHYVSGLDGQLYLYSVGAGDKALSASSETGIAWALSTRRFGGDRPNAEKAASRWFGVFDTSVDEPTATTVTIGINGATGGATQSMTYSLLATTGNKTVSKLALRIKGPTLQLTLSATNKRRFVIGPQRLDVSIGSERRG